MTNKTYEMYSVCCVCGVLIEIKTEGVIEEQHGKTSHGYCKSCAKKTLEEGLKQIERRSA